MTEYLGWHFSTGMLGHGDGRPIIQGETHRVTTGPIVPCEHGLHASAKALDALSYLSSTPTHVARVRLHGDVTVQGDKAVASDRTYLRVTPLPKALLHEFSCRCAEAALMMANVDDARSWNAIHVKREWIAGRATEAGLAAARDAAWAAARTAARDAAWDAARAAAWDAARGAAWAVASDAAWAAARDAARDAAWGAAWDEINALLEDMLLEAMA